MRAAADNFPSSDSRIDLQLAGGIHRAGRDGTSLPSGRAAWPPCWRHRERARPPNGALCELRSTASAVAWLACYAFRVRSPGRVRGIQRSHRLAFGYRCPPVGLCPRPLRHRQQFSRCKCPRRAGLRTPRRRCRIGCDRRGPWRQVSCEQAPQRSRSPQPGARRIVDSAPGKVMLLWTPRSSPQAVHQVGSGAVAAAWAELGGRRILAPRETAPSSDPSARRAPRGRSVPCGLKSFRLCRASCPAFPQGSAPVRWRRPSSSAGHTRRLKSANRRRTPPWECCRALRWRGPS